MLAIRTKAKSVGIDPSGVVSYAQLQEWSTGEEYPAFSVLSATLALGCALGLESLRLGVGSEKW